MNSLLLMLLKWSLRWTVIMRAVDIRKVAIATGLIFTMTGCAGSHGSGGVVQFNPLDKIYFAAPSGNDNLPRYYTMNPDGSNVQIAAGLSGYDPSYTSFGMIGADGINATITQFIDPQTIKVSEINVQTGVQSFSITAPFQVNYVGADYSIISFTVSGFLVNSSQTQVIYGGLLQSSDDPHNVYAMNSDGSNKHVLWTAPSGSSASVIGESPDEKTLVVGQYNLNTTALTVKQIPLAAGGKTSSFTIANYAQYIRLSRDGLRVAFLSAKNLSAFVPNQCNVDGTMLQTGKSVPYHFYPEVNGVSMADFADGFHVIYVSADSYGSQQVFTVNMDGSGVKQLTYNSVGDAQVTTRRPKVGPILLGAR